MVRTRNADILLQKSRFETELLNERRENKELVARRQMLEGRVGMLVSQLEGAQQEKTRLWKRVQELQQTSRFSVKAPSLSPRLSQQALVKQIAEMECLPLQRTSLQARRALKKKLLVKWHPDKQPSSDHVLIATAVVQELQNRPEWTA